MSELLQENLLYLYQNKQELFQNIQNYLNETNVKNSMLIVDDIGNYNLSFMLNGKENLLYSKDNSEINKWTEEYSYLKNREIDVVMYGLGLTHHLVKLIELNPKMNFYIIEPEIDIFIEALKIVNISDLLNHSQIKLLEVGNQPNNFTRFHSLLNIYSEYEREEVYIPFYATINLQSMRNFYKYNYMFRENQLIEIGFENSFGSLPYRNSIRNLETMCKTNSLAIIKNQFPGFTALIVGAGPSLECDIELIKKNSNKYFIIAAGSSIQSLLYYGIKPHMIVSMDPSETNGKVFIDLDLSDIPFVFIPQIYHEITKNKFSNVFYALFTNDPITQYLFSDKDCDYNFLPTNSVTGTAIQVAKYLGAKKIILAGQDLSFPNNNYYAKGARHADSTKLDSTISSSNLEVENVNGSINRTNLAMQSTLENIEDLISSIEGIFFYNTSKLGAKIKGTTYVNFSELVETLEPEQYDYSSINFSSQESKIVNTGFSEFLYKIRDTIKICDTLIVSNERSLKYIGKIDELSRKSPNQAFKFLEKLENEYSKVTMNDLFQKIIPTWNRGVTKRYDQLVIKIEAEPSIIGKAKLLNQIVSPYIHIINETFSDLKSELKILLEKLDNN